MTSVVAAPARINPQESPLADVIETQRAELSRLVSDVFDEVGPHQRAKVLECLLRVMSPLALLAVAAGAFARFLPHDLNERLHVSAEQVTQYSAEQVSELASFSLQVDPEVLRQVASVIQSSPFVVPTVSGTLLLAALHVWLGRERLATLADQ